MSTTQPSSPYPVELLADTKHHESAPASEPAFPIDIERSINEILLHGFPEMCGTMALVAARFRSWTKPFAFCTVRIRRSNNWTHRIHSWLLPNAELVHTLVLDLPSTHDRLRGEVPAELAILRTLLEAAGGVRHLAVTWNIWAHLQSECGTLQLQSLYLIWDGVCNISAPSLESLQHPDCLVDLTFCAPARLPYPNPWHTWGHNLLRWRQFANLAYVTYAADRIPIGGLGPVGLKGAMLVLTGREERYEHETRYIEQSKARDPQFSAVCVQHRNQILDEWVAKMQGRKSRLDHTVYIVSADDE